MKSNQIKSKRLNQNQNQVEMQHINANKETNAAVGYGLASEVGIKTRYETGIETEQRAGSPHCREVEGIRTWRRTTTRPPDPRFQERPEMETMTQ